MKKVILLTLTVVGGLFVKTLSPEREGRQTSHGTSKFSCTKAADVYALPKIKSSELA
ncbi:MAG: hypothetical protein ABIN95_11515 [Mucilaginibacter sp.]